MAGAGAVQLRWYSMESAEFRGKALLRIYCVDEELISRYLTGCASKQKSQLTLILVNFLFTKSEVPSGGCDDAFGLVIGLSKCYGSNRY